MLLLYIWTASTLSIILLVLIWIALAIQMSTNNICFNKENLKKKKCITIITVNMSLKSSAHLSLSEPLLDRYFTTSFSGNFEKPNSTVH